MALTDDEAVQAFRFLVAMLRENGYDWVVTQVEEKIALGKVRTRKLRTRELHEQVDDLWEVREERLPGTKRSALFAVAQQYTAQERLNILLDSIELAIPTVQSVAKETFTSLREFGIESRLIFEPEAEVITSFSVTNDDVQHRSDAVKRLLELIGELRRGEIIGSPTQPTR